MTLIYKPLRMDMQVLADQQELTDYISSGQILDVVWMTCYEQWTIGMDREKDSRKSMQSV